MGEEGAKVHVVDNAGDFVRERDVQQLYFVYLTSSSEDWQYTLETKGLGKHGGIFRTEEPLHGEQYSKLEVPDVGHGIKVPPTVDQFAGIPAHITLEEFAANLEAMLPTWDGFRRGYSKSHAHAKLTAKLAMVSDLLSATAMSSSADGFLASIQMPEASLVYASVERGNVNPAMAHIIRNKDGSTTRSEPTKRPFRSLAAYNGPVLVAVLEERQGTLKMFQPRYVTASHQHQIQSSYAQGTVFDPMTAHVVFGAVEKCTNYSAMLQLLLSAGLDLAALSSDLSRHTGSLGATGQRGGKGEVRCWRIMQGVLVVGCFWDQEGPMSCLRWQPSLDEWVQHWGTVCIYRDDNTDVYLKCWELYHRCDNVQHFKEELTHLGLKAKLAKYEAKVLPS